MNKTIFITGASSGIGKTTAQYFYSKGWNVIATMRNPSKEKDLKEDANLKLLTLDVQHDENIKEAVKKGIAYFGKIDVLLNNAGYGLSGVMEFADKDEIKRQFDVNVFGLIEMTKAILPHFRNNKKGRIINISSIGGLTTFPFFTYYHATKYAIEGYSESLNYELNPLGIDVKLIEPGGVKTEFTGRSMELTKTNEPDYAIMQGKLETVLNNADDMTPSSSLDVAKVIYKAAISSSNRMRYIVGKDAKLLNFMRKILPTSSLQKMVKNKYNL